LASFRQDLKSIEALQIAHLLKHSTLSPNKGGFQIINLLELKNSMTFQQLSQKEEQVWESAIDLRILKSNLIFLLPIPIESVQTFVNPLRKVLLLEYVEKNLQR
jgi:hypothetical protein